MLSIIEKSSCNQEDKQRDEIANKRPKKQKSIDKKGEKIIETDDEKKKVSRAKHPCPVYKKEVVHLPRHLRTVYKVDAEKAKTALSTFDLRVKKTSERKGSCTQKKSVSVPWLQCRSTKTT